SDCYLHHGVCQQSHRSTGAFDTTAACRGRQTCSLNDALGDHGIANFKETGNVCSRDIVTGVTEVFSGGNATVMDIFHVLFQPGMGVVKTPGVSGSVLLHF